MGDGRRLTPAEFPFPLPSPFPLPFPRNLFKSPAEGFVTEPRVFVTLSMTSLTGSERSFKISLSEGSVTVLPFPAWFLSPAELSLPLLLPAELPLPLPSYRM